MKRVIAIFACAIIVLNLCAHVCDKAYAANVELSVEAFYENFILNVHVELKGAEADGVVVASLTDNGITVCTVRGKAEKELVLKFPEGVVGDEVKVYLWESMLNMTPVCPAKAVKLIELTTVLNLEQPGTLGGFAGQFVVEDNFVYLCRQGRMYKIDVSDTENPIIAAQKNYSSSVVAKFATAMQINGDYIYVGNRTSTSGYPTEEEEEKLTAGALFVLKKSDLTVVSTTPLGKKVSGMVLYENLLIVNLQMRGWAVYDVTNPSQPVIIDEIYFETGEIQGGEVFEVDGRVYYAAAGFGDGIRMYDLTEFVEYTENAEKFKTAPTIGDDNLLWFYHFYSNGIGGNHTYDLTVRYPYVYATIAAQRAQKEDEDRVQGILTLDITNVKEAPKSHMISMIAVEDKNNMVTNSDTQPSIICRVGNTLIVNNDAEGISCFDAGANPGVPEYVGTYNPGEGSCVYRMMADDKGRLFLTDGSGSGSDPRLYIVEGFNK